MFRKIGIKLKNNPQAGSIGQLNFEKWDGKTPDYRVNADFQIWINPSGKVVDSPYGKALEMHPNDPKLAAMVDVNVSRGNAKPGIRMHHLKMRENEISIALWFKTEEKSGKIFGKDGYNAFGKGYKTVSCSIENGKLMVSPNRLQGGKIEPGTWQFIVLTASEKEMGLYLNGEKVASAAGTKEISTDALDFFFGHNASIAKLQVFNRQLEENEVKSIFDAK